MADKFIKKMEKQLLKEKKQLEKSLSKFADKDKKNKGNYLTRFFDLGDTMEDSVSEVANFSDNLSLEQNLEKALKDVDQALASIKKGDYGICKYCHQAIDQKRLEARPASSACVACKQKLQSRGRRS